MSEIILEKLLTTLNSRDFDNERKLQKLSGKQRAATH